MDFGVYFALENPEQWQVPTTEVWQDVMSQMQLAEDLGYDSIWIAEHHFDRDWFPSSSTLCGAIAAVTHRVKFGQSVTILPLYHPVQVAENAAVADILSNGRFQLGVGVGYVPEEFATFGIPRGERGSRMEEGLEIIKGCFLNESFSYNGRHYKIDKVKLWPRPVQKPHPPIWMATVSPKSAERAARQECNYNGPANPEMISVYDEALRRYGRDPKDFARAAFLVTYIAETREKAWEDCAPHVLQKMAGYAARYRTLPDYRSGAFQGMEGGGFGLETLPFANELSELAMAGKVHFLWSPFLVGTVGDVIQGLEAVGKMGINLVHLWMQIGGIDPRKTRNSMRIFAKEVMPHFSKP